MALNSTGKGKYYEGIGRRKVSTARVRLFKGKNPNLVNNKLINEYFVVDKRMAKAQRPLVVTGLLDEYYFTAHTNGGGVTGQADSVALGLARALVEMDESLKPSLKKEGLLTRDPRMVQRKKYHHRKARKKPQFSKR